MMGYGDPPKGDISFCAMARRDVSTTMERMNDITAKLGSKPMAPGEVWDMINRLVSTQIGLLRAIEEIEARPWWKPRRFNPYARR